MQILSWNYWSSFGISEGSPQPVREGDCPGKCGHCLNRWGKIKEDEGLLYRVVDDVFLGECQQLCFPLAWLSWCYEVSTIKWDTRELRRTLSLLKPRCYWAGMYEAVDTWVKNCHRCVLAKLPQPKIRASWTPFLASQPLEVVAVDFTTLEPASDGRENVLVVTDVFTKFCQAFPTRDQKADTTAKVLLKEWFLKYGGAAETALWPGEKLWERGHCGTLQVVWGAEVEDHSISSARESPLWAVLTALYMTCCARYPRTRRRDGLNTCRNWCMLITWRLTPPRDTLRITCCLVHNRTFRLMRCWDGSRRRAWKPTGCLFTGSVSRMLMLEQESMRRKKQRNGLPSMRVRFIARRLLLDSKCTWGHRPAGRNKIQDAWAPQVYVVKDCSRNYLCGGARRRWCAKKSPSVTSSTLSTTNPSASTAY